LAWRIKLTPQAERELARIAGKDSRRIVRFLRERVAPDPRAAGGPLKGQLKEFWRWRVGDYRILAKLEDKQLLVLVIRVGHRSRVNEGGTSLFFICPTRDYLNLGL